MTDAEYAGVGTAQLTSELESDGPYTISGIALGAGDVTVGASGIKKKWPADALRQAAGTLEGKPLVRDHENNTDGRVGTVTNAFYQEGVGVRYEAEIADHYSELAQDVAAGIQEVSARAYHDPIDELEEDEESGAIVVQNVVFDNLSVVSQGAAPSNTAEIGGVSVGDAVAMASGPAGGAVATLEQGSPRQTAELADYSEGDWVKGDSSGGTWHGKVRGMKSDGCYSDKIDGDQEICAGDDEPVYLIENYDPESGEFTDTMVAHKEGSVNSWDHEENALKAEIDVMAAELEADEDDLDSVYSDWNDAVNMSASQLERWSEHPCADKASVDTEAVIDRNMHLLETNKSDWGSDEMEDAKRTISFINRMSSDENKPEEPRDGPSGCPSEWAISLLNWAYNPFDSMPEVPDEMSEENSIHGNSVDQQETPDMSTDPRANIGDTPEWDEGDLVRWQVEPDLFGKIVHVDDEKHVAMVEIMGMDDGSMESSGFTITAGFSDIKPMTVPESTSDMSMHGDDMSKTIPTGIASELAEIGGMDVNGLIMWDDKMGSIAGFEMQDDGLMVEIDLIERDGGSFNKTGETVMEPMTEMEDMESGQSSEQSVEELESDWHTPDWSGLNEEKSWERPAMSDFDTDDLSEIDDHFFVSKTGEWPPENYSDLALPAVWPNGELSLDALDSIVDTAMQTDGVSDDMAETIKEKANELAQEHFDTEVMGEEMDAHRTLTVATLGDNDTQFGSSTLTVAALRAHGTANEHDNNTMTRKLDYETIDESEIEEMSDPVVIERTDVADLEDKAAEADELSDQLDSLNSSLDELAENKELLDEVDEDRLDELRTYDEAVVLTNEEHEELQGLVDEIGEVFADELAEYSPFDTEELQDRFTPLELRDKVEEHDSASLSEELGASETDPEPDGGSASTEELEANNSDAEIEMTEDDLREQVAEHLEDGKMYRQAEKVREGEIGLDEMGLDVSEVIAD